MSRKFTCTSLLAVLLIGISSPTHAHTIPKQPIELFTHSLTAFYSILSKCQNINQDVTPIEASISSIRSYVASLYRGEIPYWTLPPTNKAIHDPEICNYLLYDRMMTYEFARREYMAAYPEEMVPPKFNIQVPRNYEYIKKSLTNTDRSKRWHPEYDW